MEDREVVQGTEKQRSIQANHKFLLEGSIGAKATFDGLQDLMLSNWKPRVQSPEQFCYW